MGITGLLPFLKAASRPVHVRELSDSVVAVDVYGWLHKGAFGCAEKLVQGQSTDGYVLYVMKYVDLLLYHRIKPILVFDGRNLPAKASTEKKRRENRAKHRQMGQDYLRSGRIREAKECFQRCVDVTPAMARAVIQACHERNIDCLVAPYEADAQLAQLVRSGLAQYVVSEDSDLTLFGCQRILFKLDMNGNGVLYEQSQLAQCLGQRADAFSFDQFRYMCIMSGCDYLPSLHGIGLAKSFKFWSKVSNPDLRMVLPKIPDYLKMPKLTVTAQYVDGFVQADRTFLYQVVFDIQARRLCPLTPYPEDANVLGHDALAYAGSLDPTPAEAYQLALGNMDIHTHESVFDFDPQARSRCPHPRYGSVSPYPSIWEPGFQPEAAMKAVARVQQPVGLSQTAFGDFKVMPGGSPRPEKRKLPPLELPEVTAPCARIKRRKNDSPPTVSADTQVERVFISKYFSPDSSQRQIKAKTRETTPWFQQLEDEAPHPGQLIYNTDLLCTSEPSDTPPTTVLRVLDENLSVTASAASRQGFKPVKILPSKVCETPEKKLKRNPFAKPTPDQESPSHRLDQGEPSPPAPPPSRSSDQSSPSIQAETSPILEPRPELRPAGGSRHLLEKSFPVDTPLPSDSYSQSSYFQPSTTPLPLRKKPRGVSGLMKPLRKQRSVMDMWSK